MSSTSASPSCPYDSSFVCKETEEQIEVDLVLQSLAHPRRREILAFLEGEPVWTRAELTERLVDEQEGTHASTEDEIETDLVHNHLPKLSQADLVSLDQNSWLIQQGESYRLVREMVDAAVDVFKEE